MANIKPARDQVPEASWWKTPPPESPGVPCASSPLPGVPKAVVKAVSESAPDAYGTETPLMTLLPQRISLVLAQMSPAYVPGSDEGAQVVVQYAVPELLRSRPLPAIVTC